MKNTRQLDFLFHRFPSLKALPGVDLCCGDGKHLNSMVPGSIGIDFFQSPGLKLDPERPFHKLELEDEFADTVAKMPTAPGWFMLVNTFEHVLDPHLFLLKIRRAMPDDALFYLTVPIANTGAHKLLSRVMPGRVHRFWGGYLQHDHVNFFVPQTLDLTMQYAGFEIVDRYYGVGVPGLNFISNRITPTYGVVVKKITGWNYRNKSSVAKLLDDKGFMRFKDNPTF